MDQLLVALDVDTVAEARALADRLRGVVGRPIIAAADPRAAAERIAAECRGASHAL